MSEPELGEIRPLLGDQVGMTCDWGGCDELATVRRFDGEYFLPCCEPCSLKPWDGETTGGPFGPGVL